VAWIQNCL